MKKAFIIAAVAAIAAPALAKTTRVGSFDVKIEKDAFANGEKYIATMIQGGHAFGVRCLEGKLTFAAGTGGRADPGEKADVKIKLGGEQPRGYEGYVLGRNIFGILVQFGDEYLASAMAPFNEIAIRIEDRAGANSFFIKPRGLAQVVAGARKACGLD